MIACPLGIDTGKLVKDLRAREHGPRAERVALAAARRWAAVERGARAGLRAGDALRRAVGDAPLRGATRACAQREHELVPEWPADMPRPAPARAAASPRARARPPSTCRPASTGSSAVAGRERALSLPEALVEVSAPRRASRSGSRRTPPGTAARRRGTRRATGPARRSWPAKTFDALWQLVRRGQAAGRDRRELVRARAASRTCAQLDDKLTRARQHPVGARHGRLGRAGCCRSSRCATRASVAVHPPCSVRHLGLVRRLEALAGRARRRGRTRRRRRPAAASRATAGSCTRSCPPPPPRTRPPSWRAAPSTPTCAATAPARSACARAPAATTSRSSSCWRN